MQRMSGIDPMFVYADTPDTPMEIAYACVLDPRARRVATASSAFVTSCGADPGSPLRSRFMAVPLAWTSPGW